MGKSIDWHFPASGIDISCPAERQTIREVSEGVYSRSTPRGINVRSFDATSERKRGGSRSGTSKPAFLPNAQVAGTTWVVQHLATLSSAGSGLLNDLIAYYKLESDLTDVSGFENDLAIREATTYGSGKINNALTAGAGNRKPLLGLTSGAISIAAWIYLTNGTTNGGGVGHGEGAEVGDALRFAARGNGANGRLVVRNRTGVDVLDTGYVLALEAWFHVAMVYTGSVVRLYVNGNLHSSAAYLISGNWHLLTFGIDTSADYTTPIDEVGVWSRPISAIEVAGLYNAGSGRRPFVGASVQLSQSGRLVTLLVVSQGTIKRVYPGDTTYTAPSNNTGETPALNYTGVMASSSLNGLQYFVDGINYVYYNPVTDTVELWVASAGSLPVDSENNTARLICTWRGRICLSGLHKDPQVLHMSRAGDGTDFDVTATPDGTEAVSFTVGEFGIIGDVITALIPWSDDTLLVGCDHTVVRITGDPADGGDKDILSDVVGIAWSTGWCKTSDNTILFMSTRGSFYAVPPGGRPQRISQAIEPLVREIDTGKNIIHMQWDDDLQAMHAWITWTDEPKATTHWYWEQRSNSFFQVKYKNKLHNPLCSVVFDGNEPEDRTILKGDWDGYVRMLDPEATTDDGEVIESEVLIGAVTSKTLDDIFHQEYQGLFADGSADVEWEVYEGETAEEALAAVDEENPSATGTFSEGRNPTEYIRVANHAVYVRLKATGRWAMESIRAVLEPRGPVRQRKGR